VSRLRPPLDPFLRATSVAVIGASRDPATVGGSVLANLRSSGYSGRLVAVNVHGGTIQGLPVARSMHDVEGSVELAVIAVPAPQVLQVLDDCVGKGVKGAVIISAGFREAGAEGGRREDALRAWIAEHPLRILGPNCLGWIRPACGLNLTFAAGMPERGPIAFVSHSGALGAAIIDWARERRIGFSLFASLGNQADITEADVLDTARDDPETRVVAAYVEGVADGRRFLDALRATAARKPVVVLKAGRSEEAARAVSSHTGALAGSDRAFDAAIRQAGAARVASVQELFDVARALSSQPLPRGRRLAIVTNGGGLGIVAADAAHDAGLQIAPIEAPARERLAAVLPAAASVRNPVDLIGDADAQRYGDALHALGGDGTDAVLVLLTAQAATDALAVARAVIGATREWSLPVAAAFVGGGRVAAGARALEEAGIPCYPFPEPALRTLAGMVQVFERRVPAGPASATGSSAGPARAIAAGLRAATSGTLGFQELAPLFESYGIPCAAMRAAATAKEAAAAAGEIGGPVALKIVSPDISHKSDVGGVRLGLGSLAEVEDAAESMMRSVRAARPDARVNGVLVQQMAPPGKELVVGMVRDAQFGPMILVGFGGIYVEVLHDTAVRLCPVTAPEARAMLDELRMAPLLHGIRGEAPVRLDLLAETIQKFARLAADVDDFAELEINPLVASPAGVVAVDARARV